MRPPGGSWKPSSFARGAAAALVALTTFGAAGPRAISADDSYPVESGLHADARVRITFTKMNVYDDADWIGPGEIVVLIGAHICRSEACSSDEGSSLFASSFNTEAGTGAQVALDHVVPRDARTLSNGATKSHGIPLSRGNTYGIDLQVVEMDLGNPFDFEDLGGRGEIRLTEANNWRLGRHTLRLFNRPDDGGPLVELEYEIALMSLADLVPTSIKISELPNTGGAHLVCMNFENRGPVDAGGFNVELHVDSEYMGSHEYVYSLPSGGNDESCVGTFLPTSGLHTLSAIVDPNHKVYEQSDENNRFDIRHAPELAGKLEDAPVLTTAPSPPVSTDQSRTVTTAVQVAPVGGAQTGGKPALVVEEIRVKGKSPGSQSDCDPGENDVTVTVKNVGAGTIAGLSVLLEVDGDDEQTKTPGALDAGKSASVTFADVELKRGDHKLAASVRVTGSAGVSSSDATESREISVTCRDE
jgi:hypothetical protein